ncbi:MAG: hypothetical protein KDD20_05005 [Mangrovimonas sp.]|nr:hypothetical protein [Mangrovimonas sp.]
MIVVSKYLVPKGYAGLTVFPFVFLKTKHLKQDIHLLNHEAIHLKQQLELLVLPFFLWYLLEFLVKLVRVGNWQKAYRSISFEREAYEKQNDLNYLKSRPFWGFLGYL